MTRIIPMILLTLVLALGFSTLSFGKGGSSGRSGSGSGHGSNHMDFDDSGRHRSNGDHGLIFNDDVVARPGS